MHALVTGADGFVGSALCTALELSGTTVRRGVRGPTLPPGDATALGDIGCQSNWTAAVHGIDVVFHLAARVHVMRDSAANPLAEYRAVNVGATVAMARAAAACGARRIVFMSSVKVNGERSPGRPFTELDAPAPLDPYGQSKLEAEGRLREAASVGRLDVVIVRAPLVYGPGVRGNFLELLKAVEQERRLPLGSVRNRRSFIGLSNLVSALTRCALHPAAAGETFFASDGPGVSVPELIRAIALALGRRPRLFPVPVPVLRVAALLTGRAAALARLCESLEVDSSHLCRTLQWSPPTAMAEELVKTVQAFRARAL
jgi:nucleoside-diphosphate-sugar epimerase